MKQSNAYTVIIVLAVAMLSAWQLSCQRDPAPTQPEWPAVIELTEAELMIITAAADSLRPGPISDMGSFFEVYPGPELTAMPIIITDTRKGKKRADPRKGGGSMPIIIVHPRTAAQYQWLVDQIGRQQ